MAQLINIKLTLITLLFLAMTGLTYFVWIGYGIVYCYFIATLRKDDAAGPLFTTLWLALVMGFGVGFCTLASGFMFVASGLLEWIARNTSMAFTLIGSTLVMMHVMLWLLNWLVKGTVQVSHLKYKHFCAFYVVALVTAIAWLSVLQLVHKYRFLYGNDFSYFVLGGVIILPLYVHYHFIRLMLCREAVADAKLSSQPES